MAKTYQQIDADVLKEAQDECAAFAERLDALYERAKGKEAGPAISGLKALVQRQSRHTLQKALDSLKG